MKSEHETLNNLSAAADLKMSRGKQQAVWDAIERAMDEDKPKKAVQRRRTNLLGTSAAAIAALLLFSGGIYTLLNRGALGESSNPASVTNASNLLISQIPKVKHNLVQTLKKVGFHYTLPSWLPYAPTAVDSSGTRNWTAPVSAPYRWFVVDFRGKVQSGEQLDVSLQEGTAPGSPWNASQGTKVTLSNGITAYFDPNGPGGTTLYWYVRGVGYDLSAGRVNLKTHKITPRLDEATLLRIANSFR